jgi:hypothetical protein
MALYMRLGMLPNHQAIRFALDHGLRLSGISHLLMTAAIGRLDRYVPSGPELF